MQSLLERGNPLYGRIDLKIDLQPMDYYEFAQFYPERPDEDKVRLFSVFGGIPYYNRLIDENVSVRENLIHLILEPDARLEDEVPSYLLSEISKIGNAHEVFSALANGHARYRDILSQSHISSGATLVNVLNRLIGMQLVQRRSPINWCSSSWRSCIGRRSPQTWRGDAGHYAPLSPSPLFAFPLRGHVAVQLSPARIALLARGLGAGAAPHDIAQTLDADPSARAAAHAIELLPRSVARNHAEGFVAASIDHIEQHGFRDRSLHSLANAEPRPAAPVPLLPVARTAHTG